MTETPPAGELEQYIVDWKPAPVTATDIIAVGRVQEFGATLDLAQSFADGDALPPLWHWAFFLDWPPTAGLGADGHPRDGHFLPPIPNRRRMFAGGRLTVTAPLTIGRTVTRTSEVVDTTVKRGRSGALLFVTVRNTYRQDDELRLTEEQDLVYRSDDGSSTAFVRADAQLGASTAPWTIEPVLTPPLLFRFSALTGNAHRIHYDEAYTTGIEGYPDLVVHGPLLAVYMAELVRGDAADQSLREFQFRLQRPVFIGDAIRVEGSSTGTSTIDLSVTSGGGTVHAAATAVLS
ncbi:MaoC family dehydratase N-terminal domain-containing protein [Mycobacterium sp. SMC-8]|uniref:FAS1-like dehydratase domain-containing protein n=1 Tax=Mycobacterium sp. SMC-8 TaxID=2857060 RepID=UPI0021B1DA20|nr:MaoC family dehydratase N-terminal domain-containing protein [Mycobacterium sp. SMC-8]